MDNTSRRLDRLVEVDDYVSNYIIFQKENFLMKDPLVWRSKIAFFSKCLELTVVLSEVFCPLVYDMGLLLNVQLLHI